MEMSDSSRLGIQSGRLSPRPWPELKRFPFETWEKEFYLAAEIGYKTIEWVFDEERYADNPLWSSNGRKRITTLIQAANILVNSICADYFLKNPFFRGDSNAQKRGLAMFRHLLENAHQIGASLVVLPLIENSDFKDDSDREYLITALQSLDTLLSQYKIRIGLETNMSVRQDKALLDDIASGNIGLVYDLGNHASVGHDYYSAVSELFDSIINIHIKDRFVGGPSVFVGSGDVDFVGVLEILSKKNFSGDYIMEAYFEDDHFGTAKKNYEFIELLIKGALR